MFTARRTLALTAAATAAGVALAGPGVAQTAAPDYQEFKSSTFRDTDGTWIVNGDEPVTGDAALRKFYDKMVGKKKSTKTRGTDLTVNTVYGEDDVWSSSEIGNLTYCVSDDFGADQADIAASMADGAAMWENASSSIDFVHDTSQDADCNTSNDSVVFSVEPVSTSQYIARAFFPSSPKSERNVLVDDSIWSSGWAPENVLAHELGHTLGFRHEHTRPEAGTCFEDDNWRPLTPYDSASIMHYPQCNGSSQDLTFSSTDAEGVASIYGQ